MAIWGANNGGNSAFNVANNSYAAGGAAALVGQRLDSVHIRWGDLFSTFEIRLAVYGNSSLDIDGAELIEDLGTLQVTTGDADTFVQYDSTTHPTEISDYDFLFITLKTSNDASNRFRRNATSAIGDIDGTFVGPYDAEGTAWADPHADADSDTVPSAFMFYITHTDAAAGGAGSVTRKIVAIIGAP
jgi:hypothetical protein